jgi:hypothetical protein
VGTVVVVDDAVTLTAIDAVSPAPSPTAIVHEPAVDPAVIVNEAP